MSSCLAVILARGGSKRLPRKNLIQFGGRPMLAWSVEAALESGCFERVLVSTDDAEIAAVGRQAGADVPFLRNAAMDDQASSSAATLVALCQAEEHWGKSYGVVAQLMANCPLRTAKDLQGAVSAFDAGVAPAQISAFRFGWMNPWWAARLGSDRQPDWLFPESRSARSQDLPPLYCPSGAVWMARRDSLVHGDGFYLPGHSFYPMNWVSSLDIDDEADLAMAKACLELRRQGELPM